MGQPVVPTPNMGIGSDFQVLGNFLDDCERRGEVEGVEIAATDDAGGGLAAEVALSLPFGGVTDAPSLCDPAVGADGTVRFALDSTTGAIPAADHDVRVESADADVDGDAVRVAFDVVVPGPSDRATGRGESAPSRPDDGPAESTDGDGRDDAVARSAAVETAKEAVAERDDRAAEADPGESATGPDRDVPPFRDPDLLAEVYDSCDTFAEMADALEMDVTAETVRRYMIDYDIHEPNRYQTGGADPASAAGDEGQPVVLSDGIGLPDDVTVDALVETVERSNTIYEVKQDIDVDREDALEMLQELNLLDIVVGRLATEGERDITREDIVDRLRDASAVQ